MFTLSGLHACTQVCGFAYSGVWKGSKFCPSTLHARRAAVGTPAQSFADTGWQEATRADGEAWFSLQMQAESKVEAAGDAVAEAKKRFSDKLLDGKAMAQEVRAEVKARAEELLKKHGVSPGLAVVIVGCRPDSMTYVRNKVKACDDSSIRSLKHELAEDTSQAEVVETIKRLNADPAIHGILVQLPLPVHMDETEVLDAISAEKDVDGFHPLVIGKLAMKGRDAVALPCTPSGVMEMLRRAHVDVKGKKALVVGRSNIVGIPMSLLLLNAGAVDLRWTCKSCMPCTFPSTSLNRKPHSSSPSGPLAPAVMY